jgi:hypothetical protein
MCFGVEGPDFGLWAQASAGRHGIAGERARPHRIAPVATADASLQTERPYPAIMLR